MKKFSLILAIIFSCIGVYATTYTINVTTPGVMYSSTPLAGSFEALAPKDLTNPSQAKKIKYANNNLYDSLIISGDINIADFVHISRCSLLGYLDMSNAKIHSFSYVDGNNITHYSHDDKFPSKPFTIYNLSDYVTGSVPLQGGLVLPTSIDTIEAYGLYGLNGLRCDSLVIPANVKFIGGQSFWGCSHIKNITILGEDCKVEDIVFQNTVHITSRKTQAIYSYSKIPFYADLFTHTYPNGGAEVVTDSAFLYVPFGTKASYLKVCGGVDFMRSSMVIEMDGSIFLNSASQTLSNNKATDTVITNTQATATSNQSWLTITSVKTGDTIAYTYTATPNPTISPRIAIVTLTANGQSQNDTITQPAGDPTLSVSQTNINVSDVSSNQSVSVTSNTSWVVSSSNVSWVTVNVSSGTGNKNITLSIDDYNDTLITRSAIITVSANGVVSKTITIKQTPKSTSTDASVIDNNKNNFYPNPATTFININDHVNELVKIYNVTGILVMESKSKIIDISSLAKGLYIVNIGNIVQSLIVE